MDSLIALLSLLCGLLLVLAAVLTWQNRRGAEKIRSLEHTAALIESAPYYIAYDDMQKSDLYANPAGCEMLGRPVGQPLAKEMTHDEKGIGILFEEAFPAVEKYGIWAGENQLLHSDGHLIDVQQFIFPVKDKDGRKMGMGTLMRDITEEKAMRRSLDIQFAILDSSNSFILALDTEYQVIYTNPGVYGMSGFTREEVGLNCRPEMFHTPETCLRVRQAWETAMRDGVCEIESEFIRKDGKRLEVTHKIFTIKAAKGRIMGLGVILNDITELKRTQEDLLRAKEAAEAANKAKSFFLSNMSHEIRTPMNAIIGMSRIAKMSDELPQIRTCLEKVETSSEHLLNIINDVLDLSKIESGKLELYNTDFNLEKALRDTLGIIGVKAEEKHLGVSLLIARDVPLHLHGDANRLSQVVMNLLSNAVKFTGDGGQIDLRVRGDRTYGRDVQLEISVRDNGIGMSEAQQARLFKAFEQTDAGITARFGGTGLGLAISKRLVQMMGGDISVTSAPGEGSCFRFTVVYQTNEGTTEEATEANRAFSSRAEFAGKHVLVVEDIDINREILRVLLEPTHVEIDEAADGQQAVELFQKKPDYYDLIFMDLQMPNMDGYAATRAIRAANTERARTVPIIAMTANAFAEDVKSCLDAGMNEHISKPIDMDQVIATMRQYLEK